MVHKYVRTFFDVPPSPRPSVSVLLTYLLYRPRTLMPKLDGREGPSRGECYVELICEH